MNKTLFFIFTLSVFSSCIRYDEECLPYYLYSVTQKSDINYDMISKIDSLPMGKAKLNNEFYPVPGDYTVARFLSFSYGDGMGCSFETNNVLTLKIDKEQRIVDGYFYCLQWAEMPVSEALLRITNKGIKIKNKRSISSLLNDKKSNAKGFLVIPNGVDIFNTNIINKKNKELYPSEPNEFVVEWLIDEMISGD